MVILSLSKRTKGCVSLENFLSDSIKEQRNKGEWLSRTLHAG